jgi:hypothetical protein
MNINLVFPAVPSRPTSLQMTAETLTFSSLQSSCYSSVNQHAQFTPEEEVSHSVEIPLGFLGHLG